MKINKAVIPAAGWGTRLLPLTKAVPKVMLPVGKKPVLQRVVEEIAKSGIREIIFIVGRGEQMIRNHFTPDHAIRDFLLKRNEQSLLNSLEFEKLDLDYYFVRQEKPRGLGNAILQAKQIVGNNAFVVALGDSVISGPKGEPFIKTLIRTYKDRQASAVLAVEKKDQESLSNYGVINPLPGEKGDILELKGVKEKPRPGSAPSSYAIAARYVFTPAIFEALEQGAPQRGKEWELTDAINLLTEQKSRVFAAVMKQGYRRFDVGHFSSYYETFNHYAAIENSEED